jgi:RNA polymerase sigma factor (sigma-70 family)
MLKPPSAFGKILVTPNQLFADYHVKFGSYVNIMTDDDLLELFWHHNKVRLLGFASRVACGNEKDAEEGLDDAICELHRDQEISTFYKEDSRRMQGNWTIRNAWWWLIRCRVLDVRRKSRKDETHLGQAVPVEALDDETAKTGNDSTDAAVDRVEQLLLTAMNRLSSMEKAVIELTILHKPPMTPAEAAKEIGTTVGTIKARKYSALEKLRQYIENKCF